MSGDILPIITILSLFVGLPGVIGFSIYKVKKAKLDIQKKQLEIEQQKYQLQILEEENKKYDNIIFKRQA